VLRGKHTELDHQLIDLEVFGVGYLISAARSSVQI